MTICRISAICLLITDIHLGISTNHGHGVVANQQNVYDSKQKLCSPNQEWITKEEFCKCSANGLNINCIPNEDDIKLRKKRNAQNSPPGGKPDNRYPPHDDGYDQYGHPHDPNYYSGGIAQNQGAQNPHDTPNNQGQNHQGAPNYHGAPNNNGAQNNHGAQYHNNAPYNNGGPQNDATHNNNNNEAPNGHVDPNSKPKNSAYTNPQHFDYYDSNHKYNNPQNPNHNGAPNNGAWQHSNNHGAPNNNGAWNNQGAPNHNGPPRNGMQYNNGARNNHGAPNNRAPNNNGAPNYSPYHNGAPNHNGAWNPRGMPHNGPNNNGAWNHQGGQNNNGPRHNHNHNGNHHNHDYYHHYDQYVHNRNHDMHNQHSKSTPNNEQHDHKHGQNYDEHDHKDDEDDEDEHDHDDKDEHSDYNEDYEHEESGSFEYQQETVTDNHPHTKPGVTEANAANNNKGCCSSNNGPSRPGANNQGNQGCCCVPSALMNANLCQCVKILCSCISQSCQSSPANNRRQGQRSNTCCDNCCEGLCGSTPDWKCFCTHSHPNKPGAANYVKTTTTESTMDYDEFWQMCNDQATTHNGDRISLNRVMDICKREIEHGSRNKTVTEERFDALKSITDYMRACFNMEKPKRTVPTTTTLRPTVNKKQKAKGLSHIFNYMKSFVRKSLNVDDSTTVPPNNPEEEDFKKHITKRDLAARMVRSHKERSNANNPNNKAYRGNKIRQGLYKGKAVVEHVDAESSALGKVIAVRSNELTYINI